MILVDTSVWVRADRDKGSPEGIELDSLLAQDEVAITDVVAAEVLQGSRSESDFQRLASDFDALHYFPVQRATWMRAAELAFQLRRNGQTTALSDLIIAAVAIENGLPVYATDTDFLRVPGLQMHQAGRR